MTRLRWNGSLAADREYRKALWEHPPSPKRRKKGKSKPAIVHWTSYQEYLASKHWRHTRLQKLKREKWSCERCKKARAYQVHHKHYKTLGRERMSDLEALCRACHEREHECLVQADNHLRAIAGR